MESLLLAHAITEVLKPASGVSIPLLHSNVFPGGGKAPHSWETRVGGEAVGYVLDEAPGIGISSPAY
ncbi:MAG TPA: hypothetical protein VKB22_13360 [Gemmatimonadales bacterium]|nr:hypothetical protein [Gemmatimonadales bacterium]